MSTLTLRCHCGTLKGQATGVSPAGGTRLVCYCSDCQAFARFLGRDDIVDAEGGTDIVQLAPAQITFHRGSDQLRCLRLTRKGIYRWYAGCCNTPVANTVSAKLPFVGLVHNVFDADRHHDTLLGPVRYYLQGQDALRPPPHHKVHRAFPLRLLLGMIPRLALTRLRGMAQPSPFFDASGRAVCPPHRCDTAN